MDSLALRARKMLKDPDRLAEALRVDAERTAGAALAPQGVWPRALEMESVNEGPTTADMLRDGARGLEELQRDPSGASLTPEQTIGLEAIILVFGRPAILLQNDAFDDPTEEWQMLLEKKDQISGLARAVGRIDAPEFKRPFCGTGFLVAPDVVMTNRHVANFFCQKGADGRFTVGPEDATIDMKKEHMGTTQARYAVRECLGFLHNDAPSRDMALLRVERVDGEGPAPEPLRLAAEPMDVRGSYVYTLGYPARDPSVPFEVANGIFKGVYNVKRLQPGTVMDLDPADPVLDHDCSTLGGNSGSAVIDFETGRVLGLHFGGAYMKRNRAVALWRVRSDPFLAGRSIEWG